MTRRRVALLAVLALAPCAQLAVPPRPCVLRQVIRLRHAAPAMCEQDTAEPKVAGMLPAPIINEALIAQVKDDIWRTSSKDASEGLVAEQAGAIASTLQALVKYFDAEGVAESPEGGAADVTLPREVLDPLVAPKLPLLLLAGYPHLMRQALVQVRSASEKRAMLVLNNYVIGVYEEMGDALEQMQWRSLATLRDLCDAAMEGGTERLIEMAEAMRDDFDTDFCNYLNFAIEKEETRLRELGLVPVPPPTARPVLSRYATDDEDADARLRAAEADGPPVFYPSAELGTPRSPPSAAFGAAGAADATAEAGADGEGGELAPSGGVESQQWLLLLRLVKRGVYAMLAKDYEDDIKQIRTIIGIAAPDARAELAYRTLLELREPQRSHFLNTVERIRDNLSVPRDERDAEICAKVAEIKKIADDQTRVYDESTRSPL